MSKFHLSLFLLWCGPIGAVELSHSINPPCSIYLAPSKLPSSGSINSVIAGQTFHVDDVIDQSSYSLLISTKSVRSTQLFDYIYEADEIGYSHVLFGIVGQVNDDSYGNIQYDWESNSRNIHKRSVASANILVGDEIVTGFKRYQRYNCSALEELPSSPSCHHHSTLQELRQTGHCLSYLYLKNSTYLAAGQGVYSHVSYQPGDIVDISPVLILPKHTIFQISNSSNHTLYNFCISNNESDICLLPLGLGAMINHPLAPAEPNVEITWHSWNGTLPDMLSDHYPLNLTDLELSPFPLFNIQYKATKQINVGDEILLSYGDAWEREWLAYQASLTTSSSQPFLSSIHTNIFPKTFNSICIGRNIVECNIIRNERRIAGNETLKRLQQEGKNLSDRIRSRVLSNEFNSLKRKRFNGEDYVKGEEGTCSQRKGG